MNSKTLLNAMIVFFVAIGLTGLASAGSTTDYYVGDGAYTSTYNGYGSGDLTILTQTSYGNDVQHAEWSDTQINGRQGMTTGPAWTVIDRRTTVGIGGNGQNSEGMILAQSTDNAAAGGDSLIAVATYRDDAAYSSHVTLDQTVVMVDDNNGFEGVGAKTLIKGHAYGADTLVSGYVAATSGGQNNVTAFATINMNDGRFKMVTLSGAMDNSVGDEKAGMYVKNMNGAGNGSAAIGVYSTDAATAGWGRFGQNGDLTITNDGLTRYNQDDSFYGNPVSVTFTDNFGSNYHATGYIYVVTPPAP